MVYPLVQPIISTDLAQAIGLDHINQAEMITHITNLSNLTSGSFSYAVNPQLIEKKGCVLVGSPPAKARCTWLVSHKPRLDFIRAMVWLRDNDWIKEHYEGKIDLSANIHSTAIIEPGAEIGAQCVVGPHTYIHANVVMNRNVQVGASSVIGHEGFGYERDEGGKPIHFPHFGQVMIHDNVTIGNQCSISRGNLEDTVLEPYIKVDDQAYIAHNVIVGRNSLLMSGCKLNGRVRIERNCWIGTAAMIHEGRRIGENSLVGMGAVVIRDVLPNRTVVGNPARELNKT